MVTVLWLVPLACTEGSGPSDSGAPPADTDVVDTDVDPVDTDTEAADTDTAAPDTDADTDPAPTDDDGDGFVEPDDCDDADESVYPGAPETFDLRDEDCDGAAEVWDTSSAASVTGLRRAPGNGGRALGAGDVDGDGVVELAIADVYAGGGTIWVLSAASFTGADVADVDEAAVASVSTWTGGFALTVVPPRMRDVTGRDEVSLVVGGPDWEGGIAFAVFDGPAGDLTPADASLTASGHECSANDATELALVDMTGDGVAEIVYGCGVGGSRATVFDAYGSTGALDASDADLTLTGTHAWDDLGASIDGADLDGDGDEELVISAPAATWSAPDGGAIYVIDGGPLTGASAQADTIATTRLEGTIGGGFLGYDGLLVTDLDDDGTHEVVSQYVGGGQMFAWDLDGAPGAFTTSAARFTLTGGYGFATFGAAGDIDGDGFPDLAVAAEPLDVLLFSGADLGSGAYGASDASARLTSTTAQVLGWELLTPDLDGDGKADVIVQSADASSAATLWWFDS